MFQPTAPFGRQYSSGEGKRCTACRGRPQTRAYGGSVSAGHKCWSCRLRNSPGVMVKQGPISTLPKIRPCIPNQTRPGLQHRFRTSRVLRPARIWSNHGCLTTRMGSPIAGTRASGSLAGASSPSEASASRAARRRSWGRGSPGCSVEPACNSPSYYVTYMAGLLRNQCSLVEKKLLL